MTQPTFVFVDHTAATGGAELGLERFLLRTKLPTRLLLFERGPLESRLRAKRYGDIEVQQRADESRPSLIRQFWRLRSAMRAAPDDVYVSNSMRAALMVSLARPRRSRHLYYLQDGLDAASLGLVKRLLMGYVVLPRVAGLLGNSRWTLSTVPARCKRLPARVVYSLSGTDDFVEGASARTKGPLRIASLSRIVHWKGIDVLVTAVRRLCDEGLGDRIELTVAGAPIFGDDDYYQQISEEVGSLRCAVRMLGHVDDIHSILSSADVLVHASRRPEPFGQVIVQGLAAGLIVLATRHGGPAEIVQDGVNGFLYDSEQDSQLATLLRRALDGTIDPDLMSAAAKERARDFNDKNLTELMEAALVELARGASTAARRVMVPRRSATRSSTPTTT